MKILLFGKNGQLGWELQRSLLPLGDLTTLARDSQDFCGDLTDLLGLADTIKKIKPDVIVNAAAYTAVDRAESEPDMALLINSDAPRVLAKEAKLLDALLVHFSTDYVFDGLGDHSWREEDATNPLNIYGETKLAGEQAVRNINCKYLIFRTSWVFGARGNNFAKTMIKLAQEQNSLTVINDQHGAPASVELLADVVAHAIRTVQQQTGLEGLYHVTANGETSWYHYACFVIDYALKAGVNLKIKSDQIRPVPSNAFHVAAKRPKNSRLDTTKFEKAFNLKMPHWKTGVSRMLSEIIENKS
jgi:dTDP-4-dehydrorhamnose reductase